MTTLISALEGAKKPAKFPTAIKDSVQSFNEGIDRAIEIAKQWEWRPATEKPEADGRYLAELDRWAIEGLAYEVVDYEEGEWHKDFGFAEPVLIRWKYICI